MTPKQLYSLVLKLLPYATEKLGRNLATIVTNDEDLDVSVLLKQAGGQVASALCSGTTASHTRW